MAAARRLLQGVRALLAFTRPIDYALAAYYLTPPLMALFRQMRRSEQLHSVNVLRALCAQAPVNNDLAVAALLHDVGKSRYPLPLWHKTLPVLARAAAPGWVARLGSGDATVVWQRPFVVYAQHPAWGAAMIAEAGASASAVWLVAHHAQPADLHRTHHLYPLLKRLQRADDAN